MGVKKKIYCGIDVGKNGGLVLLDSDMKIVKKTKTPMIGTEYDIKNIKKFLQNKDIFHVGIENVHAIQGPTGNSSNFSFGFGKGMLVGLVEGLEIPYTLVHPKTWQKVAWEGVTKQIKLGKVNKRTKKRSKKVDTKKTSLIASKRLFPDESFLATSRSRTPHDGIVDAALIAYYLFCKLNT